MAVWLSPLCLVPNTEKKGQCECLPPTVNSEAFLVILQGQAPHLCPCPPALCPSKGWGGNPTHRCERMWHDRLLPSLPCASSFLGRGGQTSRKSIHEGEKCSGCVRPTAPGTKAENRHLSLTAGAERAAGGEAARLLTAAEAQERPSDAKPGAEVPAEACGVTPTANQRQTHPAEPPRGSRGVLGRKGGTT